MNTIKGTPLLILLIEDNEDHAAFVIRGMKDHRVANTIIHLADGQEALDYLFRRGEYQDPEKSPAPNLILLDLRLPKVDGGEVLQAVKGSEALKMIPIVILTSSSAETDIIQSYGHHANSYLVKPIDFEKFTKMMETLGFYWLGVNTHPVQ